MVAAERARELLARHGVVQSQPPDDWTGIFPLPASVERFFQEVGPADITIEDYGNPFFLSRLAALWEFQAGYRWNKLTGQAIEDWDDLGDARMRPLSSGRRPGAWCFGARGASASYFLSTSGSFCLN